MGNGNNVIYGCHGTVRFFDKRLFAHINLHGFEAFTHHLTQRHAPYVDLPAALRGEGDALTIDDATQAGAEMAAVAREHGHAATLFVNPWNVEHGVPYFFNRLNVLLDLTRRASVEYGGMTYPLRHWQEIKLFRNAVKATIYSLASEDERQAHVSTVACLLGVDEPPLPECLRSLSLPELQDLVSLGVRLENHGWTHSHPSALDDAQYAAEIRQGKQWLAEQCNSPSSSYAVPFGKALPRNHIPDLYSTYFLLDGSWPVGRLEHGVINRAELNL
jgi:peptidoglycan/xylan/chitin deacetylase (PgdA/CDA1 family)